MTNDSAGADFWYIINIEYSFVLRNYESFFNAVLYWWAYKCYKLWTPFFIKKGWIAATRARVRWHNYACVCILRDLA